MKYLLALVLGFVLVLTLPAGAIADDRRYLRGWPGYDSAPPTMLLQQTAIPYTGLWSWEYRQDPGVPNLHAAIVEAHKDFTDELGLVFVEGAGGNIEWARSSTIFYYGDGVRAGCPGAVGCLNEYGRNVNIWYDAPVMGSFFFESQVGVAGHEFCHAGFDCGEMYIHHSRIQCSFKPWTFMDCGIGHALRMQSFDRETIRRYSLPQRFDGGCLGTALGCGGPSTSIWYGGSDDRTLRVAVFYRTYAGYLFFTGQYLAPRPSCCNWAPLALPLGPCTDVFIGHENALPASWVQNLVRVGGTAC